MSPYGADSEVWRDVRGLGEELEVGGGDFDGGGQEAGELDEETAFFAAADA